MRVAFFPHFRNEQAEQTARVACQEFFRQKIEILADFSSREILGTGIQYMAFSEAVQLADVVIAIGGDGTMLHCAKCLVDSKAKLLGINTGRLGFLATLEADQTSQLQRLATGDYRVSERMLLEGRILDQNGNCKESFTALNEIVISRGFNGVADFSVTRNAALLGQYRADGLIFSTPTGSTAYALSAGGPVIEPEFSCIEMTMICAHSLSARPILFSPHSKLTVQCTSRGEDPIGVRADGEEMVTFQPGDSLELTGSAKTVELVDMSGNTFFDSLNRKMMQSLKSEGM